MPKICVFWKDFLQNVLRNMGGNDTLTLAYILLSKKLERKIKKE